MAKQEITLKQLRSDGDWAQVFADQSEGCTDKTVSKAPPGSTVSDEPMTRKDVAEVIAAVNGENDGESWLGVFLLKDGRYLVASGGCGYTGWEVNSGNHLIVCKNMRDVKNFGLTTDERNRLEI